jgi:hypothetical protein
MQNATVKLTYRDFEGGPVKTDEVEFADPVDAKDYADTLYRMGRVETADCIDKHGQTYFSVSREQFDYGFDAV